MYTRPAPPIEKSLENRYRVEIHVRSPVFQGQIIEKKIRSITFKVWVLRRVEYAKKRVKKVKNIFLFYTNIKM